jgi:hypothetical protein
MSAGRVGQKNGQWLVLGAGLTVAALVLMVLFQPWVNTRSEMGGAGSDGPYAMGGLVRSSGISFPECAFVVVNWEVVAGKQTNFSVYPPDLQTASVCNGPSPSNPCMTPDSGCSGSLTAPPSICFESGFVGSCSFVAAQSGYLFEIYPFENESVTFVAHCSGDYSNETLRL